MIRTAETRAVIEQSATREPLNAQVIGSFASFFVFMYLITVVFWALRRSREVKTPEDERRLVRVIGLLLGVWALLLLVLDALHGFIRHEPFSRFFGAWMTWFDVAIAIVFFTVYLWAPWVSARFRTWRSRSS